MRRNMKVKRGHSASFQKRRLLRLAWKRRLERVEGRVTLVLVAAKKGLDILSFLVTMSSSHHLPYQDSKYVLLLVCPDETRAWSRGLQG